MNKGGGGSEYIFDLTDFLKGAKYNLSFPNVQRCSIKNAVLKIFAKLTGKHLCWKIPVS